MVEVNIHYLILGIFSAVLLFGVVSATAPYIQNHGYDQGLNESGGFVQAEDVIVEYALIPTTDDLLVIGNMNITGNLYVQGCIIYSIDNSPITIGVCK